MDNDWKKRLGVVYSTSNEYDYDYENQESESTLPPRQQSLRVMLDKKNRKGKAVTLITGFKGTDDDLKELGSSLKSLCGVGGTVKNGEILLQGDHRKKVLEHLKKQQYNAKQSGG